jgi:hypothetical protein
VQRPQDISGIIDQSLASLWRGSYHDCSSASWEPSLSAWPGHYYCSAIATPFTGLFRASYFPLRRASPARGYCWWKFCASGALLPPPHMGANPQRRHGSCRTAWLFLPVPNQASPTTFLTHTRLPLPREGDTLSMVRCAEAKGNERNADSRLFQMQGFPAVDVERVRSRFYQQPDRLSVVHLSLKHHSYKGAPTHLHLL